MYLHLLNIFIYYQFQKWEGPYQNMIIVLSKRVYFLFGIRQGTVISIKQIKTGLEGNRQIYLPPGDSGSTPQEFLLTQAQLRSVGTLKEAILNLKGQIDSLLPEGPVIICFIIPFC